MISVSIAIVWVTVAVSLAIAATYLAMRRTRPAIASGGVPYPKSGGAAPTTGADGSPISAAPGVTDLLTTIAAHADRLMISLDASAATTREAREIREAALSALRLNQPVPAIGEAGPNAPATIAPAALDTAVAGNGAPAATRATGQVLVVDDEPGMREFMRLVLVRAGHEVLTVASADAALDALQRRPAISLMLVDVIMPAMDGYELVVEARKIAPKIAVVLMSAFAPDPDRHLIGDAFLAKPFSGESLTGVVDRLLSA